MTRYTRAGWDAAKNSFPAGQRWQWWPVPWYIGTCRDRIELLLWLASCGVASVIGLMAIMWFLGTAVETISQRSVEHARCLKHATNGYEIRECR